jgi:hypothetical protein
MSQKTSSHLTWAIIFPYLLVGILAVYWGRYTYDEGFYLLASTNVYEGMRPYRDFLLTQMPFLPYFYGMIMSFFGKSLLFGRWISFALGVGSLVATVALCKRKAGVTAGIVAGMLLSLNFSFIFDTTQIKTQALTVFLLSASLYFSTEPHRFRNVCLSLLFMNLAVLTRLSMLPVLVLMWGYFLVKNMENLRWFLLLTLLNASVGLAIFLYFHAEGNLFFGIYQFHSEYFGNPPWRLSRFMWFVRKVISNQFAILICFVSATIAFGFDLATRRKKLRGGNVDTFFLVILFLSYVATTAIHGTRRISYPIYQTSNVIIAVTFSALIIARLIDEFKNHRRAVFFMLFIPMIILNIPLQECVIRLNGDGSLKRITEADEYIRSIVPVRGRLLSFNTELGIGSPLSVLPRYELCKFTYFPRMESTVAEKLKLLNFDRLKYDIGTRRAEVLCYTPFLLSAMTQHKREVIVELIRKNYRVRKIIPQYGQFFENLVICTRR